MNKLFVWFVVLFAMAFSVSALDSGHLCDSVSDDGRYVAKLVSNPIYLVDGKIYYNGSHVELSSNGGSSFIISQVSSAPPYLSDVVVSNDGQTIVAMSETMGGVFFSSDGGSTWVNVSGLKLNSACISSDKRVIVAGGIVVSNDFGQSFRTLTDSLPVGYGYALDESTKRYMHFNPYTVSIGGSSLAISDDGRVIMVGNNGQGQFGGLIWYSFDSGKSWGDVIPDSVGGLGHWNGLALSCDGSFAVALASGYSEWFSVDLTGHMVIYKNGVWSVVDAVPEAYWNYLKMSCDGRDITVSGVKDITYSSKSVGSSFTLQSANSGSSWNAGSITPSGNVITANVVVPVELSYVWTARMVVATIVLIVLASLLVYVVARPKKWSKKRK